MLNHVELIVKPPRLTHSSPMLRFTRTSYVKANAAKTAAHNAPKKVDGCVFALGFVVLGTKSIMRRVLQGSGLSTFHLCIPAIDTCSHPVNVSCHALLVNGIPQSAHLVSLMCQPPPLKSEVGCITRALRQMKDMSRRLPAMQKM